MAVAVKLPGTTVLLVPGTLGIRSLKALLAKDVNLGVEIGFTMALFIAGLALKGELLDAAKVGIIGGSAISAVVGMVLALTRKQHERRKPPSMPIISRPVHAR